MYSDSISLYQEILKEDPDDTDAKIGLHNAQNMYIDRQLIATKETPTNLKTMPKQQLMKRLKLSQGLLFMIPVTIHMA
jgi:hypothetical protein